MREAHETKVVPISPMGEEPQPPEAEQVVPCMALQQSDEEVDVASNHDEDEYVSDVDADNGGRTPRVDPESVVEGDMPSMVDAGVHAGDQDEPPGNCVQPVGDGGEGDEDAEDAHLRFGRF